MENLAPVLHLDDYRKNSTDPNPPTPPAMAMVINMFTKEVAA